MPPGSPSSFASATTRDTPTGGGDGVQIGGGDTATPLNLIKRTRLLESTIGLRGRVLDAGCGAGEYVEAFAAAGASAVGVEYDATKVRSYRERHPGSERVTQGELTAIAAPDESFDLVVLNEVLEHTPDEAATLAELHRVLKPGGRLVVFAPNRLFPFETHGVIRRRDGRPLSPWIPGIPYLPVRIGRRWFVYWARNYWPAELARLIGSAGFRITERRWLGQTFENISGRQPGWVARAAPVLRRVAAALEACPGLRRLGASQVVFALKP